MWLYWPFYFELKKLKEKRYFSGQRVCIFPTYEKFAYWKKTSNRSSFGWLIRQMSINQKSGRKTFRRRFVSGSIFVSPCPPECYFQSETKIEPDLRLLSFVVDGLFATPVYSRRRGRFVNSAFPNKKNRAQKSKQTKRIWKQMFAEILRFK